MSTIEPARTHNQNHVPRKYSNGKRRVSIYWTWSYPWESNRDLTVMDNRFSTMTEVRRVAWPDYETPEWDAANFLQGIEGTLELFHRSTLSFQHIVGEATGHPVAVFQRIDQAGYKQPIDERTSSACSPASPHSTSILTCRTTRSRPTMESRFRCCRASPSTPSVHRRRQYRVQLLHLDAAEGRTRRRYPVGRLDDLHHALRRHR